MMLAGYCPIPPPSECAPSTPRIWGLKFGRGRHKALRETATAAAVPARKGLMCRRRGAIERGDIITLSLLFKAVCWRGRLLAKRDWIYSWIARKPSQNVMCVKDVAGVCGKLLGSVLPCTTLENIKALLELSTR